MIVLGSSDAGAKKYLKSINFLKYKKIKFLNSKTSLIKINNSKIDLIITGSAQGNSLDKELIKFGKKKKINTISIIEHWTNYMSRFVLYKKKFLPDYILVNDQIAYKDAIKEGLPKNKIHIAGNVFFENLSKKKIKKNLSNWAQKLKKNNKNIFIFISEKIKGVKSIKKEYSLDEFETIKKLIKEFKNDDLLIIKCHPEENISKYNKFKKKNVLIKKKINLADLVYLPKKIIGIKSNLLIELSNFRNDIISYRPKKDKKFIGEKLGISKLVRNDLKRVLYLKIKNKNLIKKKFKGSNNKINNFLKNIK